LTYVSGKPFEYPDGLNILNNKLQFTILHQSRLLTPISHVENSNCHKPQCDDQFLWERTNFVTDRNNDYIIHIRD